MPRLRGEQGSVPAEREQGSAPAERLDGGHCPEGQVDTAWSSGSDLMPAPPDAGRLRPRLRLLQHLLEDGQAVALAVVASLVQRVAEDGLINPLEGAETQEAAEAPLLRKEQGRAILYCQYSMHTSKGDKLLKPSAVRQSCTYSHPP